MMNRKLFWDIRKFLLNVLFRCKRFLFGLHNSINHETGYFSFWFVVLRSTIIQMIKAFVIAGALWMVEFFVNKKITLVPINNSLLLDALIGGIGVAGVILGLYCANISTIYSTKYSSAPESISRAFQNDQLTKRCILSLVEYIVFGFVIILEIILGKTFSWPTLIVTIVWSIMVIISFCLVGNRTYKLSDVYAVTLDAQRSLYKTINQRLKSNMFSSDANFQNYFLQTTERNIELLETTQKYATGLEINNNSSLLEFIIQNTILISSYWNIKPTISMESLWFKAAGKYQKWHLTTSTEAEIAIRTGTPLKPKNEHDYLWFENRLFEINKRCIKELVKQQDYKTIYRYLRALPQMTKSAIEARELGNYVYQINILGSYITECIITDTNIEDKSDAAGVIEALTVIYLGVLIDVSDYYKSVDLEKMNTDILSAIDSGTSIEKNYVLRGRICHSTYNKIFCEKITEGHRISPDWVIKQLVAKEEFDNLNLTLDAVIDGLNTVFSFGKSLAEKDRVFDACIILSRFYEFESKYNRFKYVIENVANNYTSYHLDKEQKWNESKLQKVDEVISNWRKEVPEILGKCAVSFAIETWDNRDDYPDFLGECYNHICEDAVEAILKNDLSQFKLDFECLTKLMLVYQEYIRTDFIKKQDLYRVEYAYYMMTYPIVEWAQIGSLAILWGEFFNDQNWNSIIQRITLSIIDEKKEKDVLMAEKLVEYVQRRDSFILGIGSRDVLETNWNIQVSEAIKQSKNYETEYWMYGTRIKTNSKLIKAFCANFPEFGFSSNVEEVFWVTCINPKLPREKQYRTRSGWEKRLYKDD